MSVNSDKVESILLAATELVTPEERAELIRRECGDNGDLQKEAERLLAAYLRSGDFLEGAAIQLRPDETESPFEQPGTLIGPYKLLQQIGEGGMGVVFMAEQDQPVRRYVALKIIKPGMDSPKVVSRFEAERQALALMDHPHIAKVFDAGTTETGRPYFVMELVKGVPITEYCDEHQLNIEQRLKLFSDVCHAVQHAHQKGIIHRDIKPSNVLVAECDDQPVPKVIDFGVAKAISQQLTERTLFTEFGQVIGTFEYMSPEQAKLNQLDVDTRTDIYSLGVLLYELLVGSTPLEKRRLQSAAFDEVLRLIGEEEPPTPSIRLNSSQTLPAISAKRRTEPEKLAKSVRGDLDWIVMKCLEKDRNRRYEAANGLAQDIERYLHDDPVQACPPSAAYRFRKFARRNKAALFVGSAAVAVLLVLVAGLAISNRLIAAQRAQAESERERAEAERRRAEDNLLRARVAVRDILYEAALGRGEWSQLPKSLRRKFAEKTTAFYESLLQQGSLSSSLLYETAVGYRSLAVLHTSLKEIEKAEQFARQSIEILDRLATEHPDVFEYHNQQAYSYYVLGATLTKVKRKGVAEPAFQRSADLYETLISQRPDVAGCYGELAYCYESLIKLQKGRGAIKDAEQTANQLLGLSPKVPPGSARAAETQSTIALVLLHTGHLPKAIEALDRAVTATNASDAGERRRVADMCLNLSTEALNGTNRDARTAEIAARKVIKLVPDYGMAYANLAVALRDQGRLDDAVAAGRKGIELQPNYAEGYVELGDILYRQGKIDRGRLDEANAIMNKVFALRPDDPGPLNDWAWRLATAEDPKQRNATTAVELASKATKLAPSNGNFWNTFGVAQYRAGAWQPAIDAFTKSIELRNGGDAADWLFLAMAHWQLGDKAEACQWYEKAVQSTNSALANRELLGFRAEAVELLTPAYDEDVAQARSAIEREPSKGVHYNELGAALEKQGKYDDARSAYRKSIELSPDFTAAYVNLVKVSTFQGNSEEAGATLRKLLELSPKVARKLDMLTTERVSSKDSGREYQRIEVPMNWHDACKCCELLGGHMATVSSKEENDFLYNHFAQGHVCWLGATDEQRDGEWNWVTGEPWQYQNWGDGEPNNVQGSESFLVFGSTPVVVDGVRYNFNFGSKWCDFTATGIFHGVAIAHPICEWDVSNSKPREAVHPEPPAASNDQP